MRELTFKHDLVLIYLNERENAYDSYELMVLLSINYDFLQTLYNDLTTCEYIKKNKELLQYQITSSGKERLRERNLFKFDLDTFLKINIETSEKEKEHSFENLFYIPQNFKSL